jgi:hypothetical protein
MSGILRAVTGVPVMLRSADLRFCLDHQVPMMPKGLGQMLAIDLGNDETRIALAPCLKIQIDACYARRTRLYTSSSPGGRKKAAMSVYNTVGAEAVFLPDN